MVHVAVDFIKGWGSVRLDIKNPRIYIRDKVARWIIEDESQRLRLPAIAKDAKTLDELVFPACDTIEVLDMVDQTIYTIEVSTFRTYATLRDYGFKKQYFAWRRYWDKYTVEEWLDRQN